VKLAFQLISMFALREREGETRKGKPATSGTNDTCFISFRSGGIRGKGGERFLREREERGTGSLRNLYLLFPFSLSPYIGVFVEGGGGKKKGDEERRGQINAI